MHHGMRGVLWMHEVRRVRVGLDGVRWHVVGATRRAEMEVAGEGSAVVDVDALAGADVVEVIEVEARDVLLEEGGALDDLALDALGVAAGGEGLAVSVLLVALDAGGRAGRALGMLGVALGEGECVRQLPAASVSPERRDLP